MFNRKSILAMVAAVLLPGAIAGAVAFDAAVDVGSHNVPVGSTAFDIPIFVTGASPAADGAFLIQVEDGGVEAGGSLLGPAITGVSFAGSIWEGAAGGYAPSIPGTQVGPQFFTASVGVLTSGETVPTDGLLLTITIDASGFNAGESFSLKLGDTADGDSELRTTGGTPLFFNITNGWINVVPEPASLALIAAGTLLLLRRRAANN